VVPEQFGYGIRLDIVAGLLVFPTTPNLLTNHTNLNPNFTYPNLTYYAGSDVVRNPSSVVEPRLG